MQRVKRKLTWFHKETDELVGELPLTGISVRQLRRLFKRPDNDPMFACYQITASHKAAIQPHATHQIRLDRYAYFIECDAANVLTTAAGE